MGWVALVGLAVASLPCGAMAQDPVAVPSGPPRPGLVPAFRFTDESGALVQCLLRGEGALKDVWLSAAVVPMVPSVGNESYHQAWLPPADVLDPGEYTVRCVRIYSGKVGTPFLTRYTYRWPNFNRGAQMSNAVLAGSVERSTVTVGAGEGHFPQAERAFDGPPARLVVARHDPVGALPQCTKGDDMGRWLPVETARPLVTNGAAIESARLYWVPFRCRPTHWTLALLKQIAGRGSASGGATEPRCNLDRLERVLLTGRSTTSSLFYGTLQQVFGLSEKQATRDKAVEHQRLEAGLSPLPNGEWNFALTGNRSIQFGMEDTLGAPIFGDRAKRADAEIDKDNQRVLRKVVNTTRGGKRPTALAIHVGLHELCGSYGPRWPSAHSPCGSERNVMEIYRSYVRVLREFDMLEGALFRSLFGSYPDTFNINLAPWRWTEFAPLVGEVHRTNSRNPCAAVAGPAAIVHAPRSGAEWRSHGVGFVDVFTLFEASPSTRTTFQKDGVHPLDGSDDQRAAVQLQFTALCGLRS